MYNIHTIEEYNQAMNLRKLGWGSTKISSFLYRQGIHIKKTAINRWIYKNGRSFTEAIRHNIPESSKILTKEKAYVLGTLCGDGYIRVQKSSHSYLVGLDVSDEDFADEFRRCLSIIYNLSPSKSFKIRKTTNYCKTPKPSYVINLTSKLVVEDLLNYSTFKTKEWIVPSQIKNSSLEIKGYFIKGLFDSEGSIRLRRNGFAELQVCSGNRNSLLKIKEILEESFGIIMHVRFTKHVTRLTTSRYKDIFLFSRDIGFTIKRKKDKLIYSLSTYKRTNLRSYTKEFKLKALKLLNEGYSAYEIGKIMKFNYTNVYDFVKQQKRECFDKDKY